MSDGLLGTAMYPGEEFYSLLFGSGGCGASFLTRLLKLKCVGCQNIKAPVWKGR